MEAMNGIGTRHLVMSDEASSVEPPASSYDQPMAQANQHANLAIENSSSRQGSVDLDNGYRSGQSDLRSIAPPNKAQASHPWIPRAHLVESGDVLDVPKPKGPCTQSIRQRKGIPTSDAAKLSFKSHLHNAGTSRSTVSFTSAFL